MDFLQTIQEGLEQVLKSGKDLSTLLLECLQDVTSKQIQKGLGDRSQYIGASDLNNGCIRKTILGKRHKRDLDLQSSLFFMRGHLAELIIMMALRAKKVSFIYQPELVHPDKPYQKAHLDFMFMGKNRIHVLDIKTGKDGKNLNMYKPQIENQMGLVKLNYPEVEKVTGAICHIDLTSALFKYENGFEFDPEAFAEGQKQVDLIWDIMQYPGTEDAHTQKTPLCGWCDSINTCPRFIGSELPEVDDPELIEKIQNFLDLGIAKDQTESAFETSKEELTELVKAFGCRLKIGGFAVGTPQRGRKGGIDEAKLKREKPDVWADIDQNYRKNGSKWNVLEVDALVATQKAA